MNLKKALVVDDSRSARASLRKTLEKLNLQVDCVESGQTALSYLNEAHEELPDIIFMDNLMPGMDGFSTSKTIHNHKDWSHIPIIMCTATAGVEYVDQALSSGAIGLLPKPATLDQINHLIQQKRSNTAAPLPHQENDERLSQLQLQLDDVETRLSQLETRPGQIERLKKELMQIFLKTLEDTPMEKPVASVTRQLSEQLSQRLTTLKKELHREISGQIVQSLKKEIDTQLKNHAMEWMGIVSTEFKNQQPSRGALLEEARQAAHFVATHQSVETSERIAKDTARYSVEKELQKNKAAIEHSLKEALLEYTERTLEKTHLMTYGAIGLALIAVAVSAFT